MAGDSHQQLGRGSPFLGRVEELASLARASSSADAGQPSLVLVDGEPGMGKTALLDRFVSGAAHTTVIRVAGDQDEAGLPFGILDQILLQDAADRPLVWPDPFAAGAALLRFVGRVSAGGLLMLVLDDAQDADTSSMLALNFMMRRLRHDRVLVVMAGRSQSLDHLPGGIRRLARAEDGWLHLAGLTVTDIIELSAATGADRLSSRAARRLCELTSGNPLHIKALLREVTRADIESGNMLPAPVSLSQLVLGKLATTTADAQAVACAAAVLGAHSVSSDILAVADVPADRAAAAFEELNRIGILRLPAEPGFRARFEHPLVRAAIYTDLGPAARSRLHTRAAAILSGAAALQHRAQAALAPDSDLAADLERHATVLLAQEDRVAAGRTMLQAARHSVTEADVRRRLLSAVRQLVYAGDAAAAAGAADDLRRLPRSSSRLHLQARLALLSGHRGPAADLARQAWETNAELAPTERDELAALLAQIDLLQGEGVRAAEWAATALEDGHLDLRMAPLTRALQAQTLCTVGKTEEAGRLLGHLPAQPASIVVASHPELVARGFLKLVTDDLAGAVDDFAASVAPIAHDFAPYRLTAMAGLAQARFRSGDWDQAQETAETALSLIEDTEQVWLAGFGHAVAATVPTGRGDFVTADAHVAAAQELAVRMDDVATANYADDAAVFVAACKGAPAAVAAAATRLRGRPAGPQLEPGVLTWPVAVAAALVDLGQLDEAETELEAMRQLTEARNHASRLAGIARVTAQLEAARKHTTTAGGAFERAVDLADRSPDVLEQAVTRATYGCFLRRRGAQAAAINLLTEARIRFLTLQAAPFVRRCDNDLRDCGVGIPSGHVPHSDLTPQERLVARLVCEGRTNQQIAEELVLSVKTIGYHLGNVYTKLDVHSRVQLLAAMTARGSQAS